MCHDLPSMDGATDKKAPGTLNRTWGFVIRDGVVRDLGDGHYDILCVVYFKKEGREGDPAASVVCYEGASFASAMMDAGREEWHL